MPKDEPLRQAKLSYLKKAEGRMLAPQYWAGFVIMGDTSTVILKNQSSTNLLLITVLLLLVGGIGYFIFRRYTKKFSL